MEHPGDDAALGALDAFRALALTPEQCLERRQRGEGEGPASSFLVVPGSRRTARALKSTWAHWSGRTSPIRQPVRYMNSATGWMSSGSHVAVISRCSQRVLTELLAGRCRPIEFDYHRARIVTSSSGTSRSTRRERSMERMKARI